MKNNPDKALENLWESSIFADDLPVGIYSITPDGSLMTCNRKASAILKLPEGDLTHSIKEFYCVPDLLEQMQQQLNAAKSQWIEKRILLLKVEGHEVIVQHHMRAIKDSESGETVGFLCCMADITEEEHYRQLFGSLPVGIYEVDEQDQLINANPAMVRMLGYESPAEIENQPAGGFYLHTEKAIEFRRQVEGSLGIIKQQVELLKKDGEIIVAEVIARRRQSPEGDYIGRQGVLVDTTREAHIRLLQEQMPVGLYEVRLDAQGESIVKHCNEQFASLIEFDTAEEAKGFNVRELYPNAAAYERLCQAIEEKAKKDEPLLGYQVPVRGRKGKEMVLEINTRVLRDRNRHVIGRVGVVRDVSEAAGLRENERKLSEKVRELTRDIGNILHSYSTALLNTHQSMGVVIRSLNPDPFEHQRGLMPEETSKLLIEPAQKLAGTIEQLVQLAEDPQRASTMNEAQRVGLLRQVNLLRNFEMTIPHAVTHPSTLRESAQRALTIAGDIKGKFPKDPFRQIKNDAQNLIRIANLITLHQISDHTLEMDHVVNALRGFVLSGVREREAPAARLVRDLVSQTTQNLHEFARSQGIAFRVKQDHPDCLVDVVFRDVVRALSNLLHNAIKYSWRRPEGSSSWISIQTKCADGFACIEFENYGVPIPKEEIDQELVFQVGFRGSTSNDRRRTGTGIGLADSLQVAKEHGGRLIVRSRPALFSGKDDDYTQPFLTTSTFLIPISIHKEKR